jgi:lycopene cyclase domain-containing protein
MKTEYFLVLCAILVFPLIFSRLMPLRLYGHPRALILSMAIVCGVYWTWDVIAAARGHWTFNPSYVLDARILGLPVEEWLFFPVIAFISVFTFEAVRYVTGRMDRK